MSDEALNMTEAQWAASTEPFAMLDFLRAKTRNHVDKRRLRLFACACCREIWHLLTEEASCRAIEVAERYADQLATVAELETADVAARTVGQRRQKDPFKDACWAASNPTTADTTIGIAAACVFGYAAWALAKEASKKAPEREAHRAATFTRKAGFVRDLFGNPFYPMTLTPECQTQALVALAQRAYDERIMPAGTLDPTRIAALAAALKKSGAPRHVLEHLGGPGPHVRGCWAVDAVLGREVSLPDPEPEPPPTPAAPTDNEYAPCFGWRNDDGSYSLGFTAFDATAASWKNSATMAVATPGTLSWTPSYARKPRSFAANSATILRAACSPLAAGMATPSAKSLTSSETPSPIRHCCAKPSRT
jgi:hypothetical protein